MSTITDSNNVKLNEIQDGSENVLDLKAKNASALSLTSNQRGNINSIVGAVDGIGNSFDLRQAGDAHKITFDVAGANNGVSISQSK
jgi:hypothetical protein